MISISRLLVSALFFAAPLAAQSVHVVDLNNGAGTDFVSLNAAVAAAASGDMILIREGDYSNEFVALDGRGLTLQGESGADVTIAAIIVRNLPAGEFFAARNLTVQTIFSISSNGISAMDCQGSLWLEDVHVLTPRGLSGASLFLQNCDQAVLIRCQLDPGVLGTFFSTFIFDSEVHLFDCVVEGAMGAIAFLSNAPGDGAVLVDDGELFVYGSTLAGGAGADSPFAGGNGSAGGAGLTLNGTSPTVHILDSVIVGGAGGLGNQSGAPGMMGAMGADIVQNAPSASVLPDMGKMRSFEVNSPVRENATLTIMANGFLGDQVFVSTPNTPGPTLTGANFNGAAVVTVFPVQALGTLAASGPQTLPQTIGQLAPGQEFQAVFAQAYFFDTGFTVGTPTMTVFLDDSF